MKRHHAKVVLGTLMTIVVASIIGSASSTAFNFGLNHLQFYSVGDLFSLSVAPNRLIACSAKDVMSVKFTGGSYQEVQEASASYNPMISYNLVDRNSRVGIDSFQIALHTFCNTQTNQGQITNLNTPIYISGSVVVDIQATDSKGVYRTLPSQTITITKQPMNVGIDQVIGKITLTQSQVNSALDIGNGDYMSWVVVHFAPYVQYSIPEANSVSTWSSSELVTSYLTRVVNDVPQSQLSAPLGTQNNIQDFNPKVFQLPFAANQGFITVVGQEDNWKPSEGYPWVEFVSPSGTISNKIHFTSYSNTDNDIWTEFKATIQLQSNAQSGTWKIIMGSDQALRSGTASRTFSVLAPVQTTPVPSSQGSGNPITGNTQNSTVLSSGCNASGSICVSPGLTQFKYEADFAGNNADKGVLPVEGLPTMVNPLDLIHYDSGGGTAFQALTVESLVKFSDPKFSAMNIISQNIQTTVKVHVTGSSDITFGSTEIPVTQVKIRDPDGTFHLTNLQISSQQVENKIQSAGINPSTNKVPTTIYVILDGTFTLQDSNGKSYQGILKNAQFLYPLYYVPSGSYTTDNNPTFGGNNNPGGSSGSSSGGNANQCTDLTTNQPIPCSTTDGSSGSSSGGNNGGGSVTSDPGSKPSANPGITGACSDVTTCASLLTSLVPNTGLDSGTLYLLIFAFFMFIILMSILIMRKR